MYKYGGVVIHQSQDELGLLEVVEDGACRSLHFGSEPKQSSMELNNPLRLSLAYTRAMMSALLFNAEPRRILLVGLGGGSLAKFLLHHFPHCRIDAVEFRERVYQLARGYFQLPDDPRLTVHIADAGDFMRQADASYGEYDLMLLDAFTSDGLSRSTSGLGFFEACRARLSATGVLAANLWSADSIKLGDVLDDMRDTFDERVLQLPVGGKANVIALATRRGTPRRELRKLGDTARELQQRLDVEFATYLNSLRKYNRTWF